MPVHLISSREVGYLEKSLKKAIGFISDDTACVGWFLVKKTGETKAGYSYEAGVTDCHLCGGVEILKEFIKKTEGI